MSTASDYCKQIKEGLRRHANFPPDLPVALGDFGRVRDHIFERVGNIRQLGLTFGVVAGAGKAAYSFKSQGGVDVALMAKGELDPAGVTAVRAGIDITFSRAQAVFFAASGVTVHLIDDLRALEASLIALLDQGRWEADFYVVTELSAATKTTAIAAASADSSIRLEAASPALDAIHLGDASLELQVKRSRNTSLEIVTEAGHTPLMQLARLRGIFHDELRPDGGGLFGAVDVAAPRFRLAADPDVEALPDTTGSLAQGLGAAAAGVEAAMEEAETRSFAAATLAVQPAAFEKTRALEIYLPMLRASYDFSHGNPDPPLPAALDWLATVEVGLETLAGIDLLTDDERAAVENDRRALDEEAGRGMVAAAAIANPGGFGFVARVRDTGEFLVSIRGTQTPEEWVKNFTAVPNPFNEVPGLGLVHLGFEQMWRRVRMSVFDGLRNVPAGARITFVGHSLGGAMATLGAADVKRNLGRDVTVDLWTVGCPRVGLIRFRGNFNRLIPQCFRVVNQGDVVPHVPSVLQFFAHVGKEVDVKGHDGNAHSVDAYEDGIRKLAESGISAAASVGTMLVPSAATL